MDANNAAGKPYDLTTIYAISDNNPQFLEKLLLIFAENVTNDMQGIKDAAAAGDWATAGQLAHKMKPSLTHFGIEGLKGVVLGLEHPASYDAAHLNGLVTQLYNGLNDVLSGLKDEFPNVFKG